MKNKEKLSPDPAFAHALELSEIFHLMGDASRLRILLACREEAVPVGFIAESLNLSASLVSHHLRLLRAARLVRAERRGKQIFYSLDDDHIRDMLRFMLDHLAEERGHGG